MRRVRTVCALGLLLFGCTGGPVDPRILTEPKAAELLSSRDELREAVLLEVPSNLESLTGKALQQLGYLAPAQQGRVKFAPTEKGTAAVAAEKEFMTGVPVYYFAVGHRELVGVAAMTDLSGRKDSKEVTFTYRVVPNDLGRRLLDAGIRIDALARTEARNGKALLALYDDGWRVELVGV